jgi:N-acetylglutamate synthase-like GNAT family acetyltransferase
MEIRVFKEADSNQVRKLINSIMSQEFSDEEKVYFQDDLQNISKTYGGKKEVFFVAEEGNEIIGTVAIKEEEDGIALLRRLFVHSDYRSRKYGQTLLEKSIHFCQQQHYRIINFRSTDRMKPAIELCKKNGFHERAKIDLGSFQIIKLTLNISQDEI